MKSFTLQLFACLSFVFLFSCKGKNEISGNIKSLEKDTTIALFHTANPIQKPIELTKTDSLGNFTLQAKIDSAGYYKLSFGKLIIIDLYLEKGGDLHLTSHKNALIDSLKMEGSMAKTNQFILDHKKLANSLSQNIGSSIETASPQQTATAFTNLLSKMDAFVEENKKGIPPLVEKVEKNRLKYQIELFKENLNQFYKGKDPKIQLPDFFKPNFIKSPDLELLTYLENYRNFYYQTHLDGFIKFFERDIQKNNGKEYVPLFLQYLKENKIAGKPKDYLLFMGSIENLFERLKSKAFETQYLALKKEIKNPVLLTSMESLKKEKMGLPKGQKAPDFELKNAQNKSVSLYGENKKIILLDLWATLCEPCKEQSKTLDAFQSKNPEKIKVFHISLDPNKPDFDAFVKSIQNKNDHYFSPGSVDSPLAIDYFVTQIPRYYILNQNKEIVNSEPILPTSIPFKLLVDSLLAK